MKGTIEIQNLKCGGCAATIQKKVEKTEGVDAVTVDVESSTLFFNYDEQEQYNLVVKTLAAIGYPIVGSENSITKKAKSYVSCAIGKIQK